MNEKRLQTVNAVAVSCRALRAEDREAVIELLTFGFSAQRDRLFWEQAFDRLAARTLADGVPRFGYGLEAGGALVGVLLLIVSERLQGGVLVRRCNVSSLFVKEGFRPFGSLLVNRALRDRQFVYVNVTPAPETWALLAAQGYRRFAEGRVVAVPALSGRGGAGRCRRFRPDQAEALPADELRLLRDHVGWGCLAVICEGSEGAVPFVFGRRRRRGVPFAYLLYARSEADVEAHARGLGLFLLRHGIPFFVADANSRFAGMPGRFLANYPKFVRGEPAPSPIDLAYTERAIFGV